MEANLEGKEHASSSEDEDSVGEEDDLTANVDVPLSGELTLTWVVQIRLRRLHRAPLLLPFMRLLIFHTPEATTRARSESRSMETPLVLEIPRPVATMRVLKKGRNHIT